jgi:hypothetical protein
MISCFAWYILVLFFSFSVSFLHASPPLQWEELLECDIGERMRRREREYILFYFLILSMYSWLCISLCWSVSVLHWYMWCALFFLFLFVIQKITKIFYPVLLKGNKTDSSQTKIISESSTLTRTIWPWGIRAMSSDLWAKTTFTYEHQITPNASWNYYRRIVYC